MRSLLRGLGQKPHIYLEYGVWCVRRYGYVSRYAFIDGAINLCKRFAQHDAAFVRP